MTNVVRKGKRIESMCADELRAKGFNVWQSVRVKYRNLDLWGLFDIAAQDPKTGENMLIQCKSNRCDTETRDAVRKFKVPEDVQKWIWIWKDRKGWVKEFYS